MNKEDFKKLCEIFMIPYESGRLDEKKQCFQSSDVLSGNFYDIYKETKRFEELKLTPIVDEMIEVNKDKLFNMTNGEIELEHQAYKETEGEVMVVTNYKLEGQPFTVIITKYK